MKKIYMYIYANEISLINFSKLKNEIESSVHKDQKQLWTFLKRDLR